MSGSDQASGSRKLGRGIGALMGVPAPVAIQTDARPVASSRVDVRQVPLGSIRVSPFQPRKVMDPGALARLADSIRHSGVMQPVIVRPISDGVFELVAGERRWRAAEAAGLTVVPALVRELTDEDAAEWALVENVQREDLNPIERGLALKSLVEKFGLTHAQIATRIGLERSTVANFIRLTELEPEIAAMIARGELSGGHGRALLSIPPGEARMSLAREAAVGGWNVRKVEMLAQAHAIAPENIGSKAPKQEEALARQAVLRDLERQIGQKLATKVLITTDRSGAKGKLTIEFYSIDHFDGLLARLGIPTHS
jgi:ParB family transcriptional regulator, chromosome partitioning protein